MAKEEVKLPLRIEVCLPFDDWRPLMLELLSHGNSGQLHALIDKIPVGSLPRSRNTMKRATRYNDRHATWDPHRGAGELSAEFREVLVTIVRSVPLPVLFQELLSWGYGLAWRVDVIDVTSGGMPRTK
jgi:hypothetical protein